MKHASVFTLFILMGAAPMAHAQEKARLNGFQVPQYELYRKKLVNGKNIIYKVDKIPKLDIGSESRYADKALAQLLVQIKNISIPSVKPLPDLPPLVVPAVIAEDSNKLIATQFKKLSLETVPAADAPKTLPIFKSESATHLAEIKNLTPLELKLLQAFIFFEIHKNYEFSLALSEDLKNEESVKNDVIYISAMSGYNLKLSTLYKDKMLQLLNQKNSSVWLNKSLNILVKEAHRDEVDLVPLIEQRLKETKSDITSDAFLLNEANYYFDQKQLDLALSYFLKINPKSELYDESLFYQGLIYYRQGLVDKSIATFNSLLDLGPEQKIKSSAALTLARIYFQVGKYKESYKNYLLVDKSHPDWMQSAIEQSWAQILDKDYIGAAGNMFTIHTDVFRKTYAPESYLSRSVSYINLCQYGDGIHVIKELEAQYSPLQKSLEAYQKQNSDPNNYYMTVKKLLQGKEKGDIDNLHQDFILQWAKYPTFTSLQKQLNGSEDELIELNKITLDIIKKEKYYKDQAAAVIKKMKAEKDPLAFDKRRVLSYEIQSHIAHKALGSIKQIRAEFVPKIDTVKNKLKIQIAVSLKKRFDDLKAQLDQFLGEVDVVKYEIFSGAGEHLRYQMAGGEIKADKAPELTDKDMQWNFNGEVWEDELGHYRSSLKNVCAKDE